MNTYPSKISSIPNNNPINTTSLQTKQVPFFVQKPVIIQQAQPFFQFQPVIDTPKQDEKPNVVTPKQEEEEQKEEIQTQSIYPEIVTPNEEDERNKLEQQLDEVLAEVVEQNEPVQEENQVKQEEEQVQIKEEQQEEVQQQEKQQEEQPKQEDKQEEQKQEPENLPILSDLTAQQLQTLLTELQNTLPIVIDKQAMEDKIEKLKYWMEQIGVQPNSQ